MISNPSYELALFRSISQGQREFYKLQWPFEKAWSILFLKENPESVRCALFLFLWQLLVAVLR